MEPSFLASWQFENFSTAELSPPTSPVSSPSSPLFYDGSSNPSSPTAIGSAKAAIATNNGNGKLAVAQSHKPGIGLSSRAQAASNMLNELERLNFYENQNAFGMSQAEESVDLNMDLFEELQDIEFTPPTAFAAEDKSSNKFEVPSVSLPVPVPVSVVNTTPSLVDNTKLSAEFKSIVESLATASKLSFNSGNDNVIATSPNTNYNQVLSHYGSLFEAAGIPTTTVVGDECLVPVEFIGRPSAPGLGAEEAESMDLDGIIISDDLALIDESELFTDAELSAELVAENDGGNATLMNGDLPYWAKDMTIPVDELDTQMERNVDALDALLKGDVSAAKNVISTGFSSSSLVPAVQQAFSPVSNYSSDDDSILAEDAVQPQEIAPIAVEPVVEENKKSERRGRKPAKNKNSLTYIKDKSLRKKEQNKTAATRYRQKKKQELAVTLGEEEELQAVHDELDKQKQKLGSEISVIRSLLREMLQARKKRVSPASSTVTASSLVQAQRIARARK